MDRYKLYIFDWDGTLMDSINKIVHTLQGAAQLSQLAIPSDQAVKNIIGMSLTKAAQQLFGDVTQHQIDAFVETYKHHYKHGNTTPAPMYDGCSTFLTNLREANKLIAVATGKAREGFNDIFALSNVDHLFHTTRCGDEAISKPNPDMLLQILDELNVNPCDALMVGDSHFDLLMAQNAKVDSIGITHGVGDAQMLAQYQPQAIVHSLDELNRLIFK